MVALKAATERLKPLPFLVGNRRDRWIFVFEGYMPSFYLDNNQRPLIESHEIELSTAAAPVCFYRKQS
jgi:hypothetical protein